MSPEVPGAGEMMPKQRASYWLKCLNLSLVVWGAELLFIRVTGDAQPMAATLLTPAIYLLVTAPLLIISGRLGPSWSRPYSAAISAGLPAIYVCAGYPLVKWGSPVSLLLAAVFGLLAVAALFIAVRRKRRFALPPGWLTVSLVLISMVITTCLRTRSLPPLSVLSLLVFGAGLLSFATAWRYGVLFATALLFIGTLVPGRLGSPTIRWYANSYVGKGPDIVLIVVDTLRADIARGMKVYKRIREAGVEHRQTQSASPWTLPSIASILTGRPPKEHGATRTAKKHLQSIHDDVTTLPEHLSKLGYDCFAAVSKNPYVLGKSGFQRGFAIYDWAGSFNYTDSWLGRRPIARPTVLNAIVDLSDHLTVFPFHYILDWLSPYRDADYVVDRALALAKKRRGVRPLFLFVHLLDPHLPYKHAYKADLPVSIRRAAIRLKADTVRRRKRWRTERGKQWLWRAYSNEVDVVDAALMRLLDSLGDPGPRGRVVMLTADHGEEIFDHGGFEHGHTFYQELLHVPLVVSGLPRTNPLGRTKPGRVVGLIDIAPALVEAAGGAPSRISHSAYLSENLLYGSQNTRRNWAVRSGKMKAITREGNGRLYNLARDPKERHPLKGISPEDIDALRALAVENRRSGSRKEGKQVKLTPAEHQALRELGYLSH